MNDRMIPLFPARKMLLYPLTKSQTTSIVTLQKDQKLKKLTLQPKP